MSSQKCPPKKPEPEVLRSFKIWPGRVSSDQLPSLETATCTENNYLIRDEARKLWPMTLTLFDASCHRFFPH